MNEIIQHFLKTIRGSDNNKRKHLTDLKERMDVVCKEVRRDNAEKRRIEEENRKKVLEKALEVVMRLVVEYRCIRTEWKKQLDSIFVLMRNHSI